MELHTSYLSFFFTKFFFGPIFFHAKALSVVSVTNMRYELTLWGQVKVWWYTLYTLYIIQVQNQMLDVGI